MWLNRTTDNSIKCNSTNIFLLLFAQHAWHDTSLIATVFFMKCDILINIFLLFLTTYSITDIYLHFYHKYITRKNSKEVKYDVKMLHSSLSKQLIAITWPEWIILDHLNVCLASISLDSSLILLIVESTSHKIKRAQSISRNAIFIAKWTILWLLLE